MNTPTLSPHLGTCRERCQESWWNLAYFSAYRSFCRLWYPLCSRKLNVWLMGSFTWWILWKDVWGVRHQAPVIIFHTQEISVFLLTDYLYFSLTRS
jgi:hypothetical protein